MPAAVGEDLHRPRAHAHQELAVVPGRARAVEVAVGAHVPPLVGLRPGPPHCVEGDAGEGERARSRASVATLAPRRPARYAGLPSPWAQRMREARSGISREASSPASSMRSHRLRFHSLGNSGSLRQASATLIPLRWNSQSIPSRSCLVYIPGSLPDQEGPIVRPGSLKLQKARKVLFVLNEYASPYNTHLPNKIDVDESLNLFNDQDKFYKAMTSVLEQGEVSRDRRLEFVVQYGPGKKKTVKSDLKLGDLLNTMKDDLDKTRS